jgi:hypothetical protein
MCPYIHGYNYFIVHVYFRNLFYLFTLHIFSDSIYLMQIYLFIAIVNNILLIIIPDKS